MNFGQDKIADIIDMFVFKNPNEVVLTDKGTLNGDDPYGADERVEVSRLKIDDVYHGGYQRSPKNSDLTKFENYDHAVFNRLIVSDRQWGSFKDEDTRWILNGGHRTTAVRKMIKEGTFIDREAGMDYRLPAIVHKTYSQKHEAALFLKLNTGNKTLTAVDKFWVEILGEEDEALDIKKITENNNCRIAKGNEKSNENLISVEDKGRLRIEAVAKLRHVYQTAEEGSGKDLLAEKGILLDNTLHIVNKAWFTAKKAEQGVIILGLATFLELYGHKELLDMKTLIDVLNSKENHPQNIKEKASEYREPEGVFNKKKYYMAKFIDKAYSKNIKSEIKDLVNGYTGDDEVLERNRKNLLAIKRGN